MINRVDVNTLLAICLCCPNVFIFADVLDLFVSVAIHKLPLNRISRPNFIVRDPCYHDEYCCCTMAQFVNNSFCGNRCFDRGFCYVLENKYHCLCQQPSAYDDCRDINLTTTATTTTITQQSELSTQTKVVCVVVAVVFLGLALIILQGWQQMSTTWRSAKVEQAKGKSIFFLQNPV